MDNKCTYTALKKINTLQSQPHKEHRLNLVLKSLSCEEVYTPRMVGFESSFFVKVTMFRVVYYSKALIRSKMFYRSMITIIIFILLSFGILNF